MEFEVAKNRHPYWSQMYQKWRKWRFVYAGGDDFIEEYVEKFSEVEEPADFARRKRITPASSFAKSVINEIKNSIFQRMADVTRRGGSDKYQQAVNGKDGGVDRHGKSMNQFVGTEILPELLPMARVGVFMDQPPLPGPTMRDQIGMMPYLYVYRTEQICSWTWRKDLPDEYQSILLEDSCDECCKITGLPIGQWTRYRYMWMENGKCQVRCYNAKSEQCDLEGQLDTQEYTIDLPYIPFVVGELTDSLLTDVANHQIALVNMESADVSYSLRSNIPIYTEQSDGREDIFALRGPAGAGGEGTAEEAATGRENKIKVGVTHGRRYGKDLDRPGFISPSSEPLKASMDKQKALKDDIRQLVNLSLSNIKPKMASAESKAIDERGLEAGLSYIGLVLEHIESKLAKFWAAYEGQPKKIATVAYPKNYSLQTDQDRRDEVEGLEELRDSVPSKTFQKAVSKRIAHVLMGGKEATEILDQVISEIESAETTVVVSVEHVTKLVETGVLAKEDAEKILSLPTGTVKRADEEHAKRLAAIAEAQAVKDEANAAARGNPDASGDPKGDAKSEKAESRDTTGKASVAKPVRGEGKQ